MVSSGMLVGVHSEASPLICTQLGATQTLGAESRHQEDYTIRSFDVLSADTTRDEAAEILQP
jgi:hypothetical protein